MRSRVAATRGVPNEEWAIDFKGWFRTADGERCDPLTITDAASRYLIEVRIVEPTWAGVRGAMERVSRRSACPAAIRSDNGSPFGSTGAGGLSALSVWWLKLGIEPRYIPPSSPQDNGRHERMHRTLKAQTSSRPAAMPASSRRASIASARTTTRSARTRRWAGAAGDALAAADSHPADAPRRPLVRRRPRGPPRATARQHQVAGRARVHRRGTGGRAGRPCRARERRHIVRFCDRDLGRDRPQPPVPALCSAACAAARRSGTSGDSGTMSEYCQASARSKMSGINPVGHRSPHPRPLPLAGRAIAFD